MELLRWKTRISVLWLVMVVNYMILSSLNVRTRLVAGEGEATAPNQVIAVTIPFILAWLPFIMAWLSLTLKDSANRWTNMIVGILFAIRFTLTVIPNPADVEGVTITTILMQLATIMLPLAASLLIIWYAWKWPKQEA